MSITNPVPTPQQSPWIVAATFTPCPDWNAKMKAYLHIDALARAYAEFGEGARLSDKWGWQDIRLQEQFGPNFRNIPEARAILSGRNEEVRDHEERTTERFFRPLWAAQRELALTPAPTIAAALFKADMIEASELSNDSLMERDCFEIVAEDFARLSGEAP